MDSILGIDRHTPHPYLLRLGSVNLWVLLGCLVTERVADALSELSCQ